MELDSTMQPSELKTLFEMKTNLPKDKRKPISRLVLLHAHQATHGTNAIMKNFKAMASKDEQDALAMEVYRKMTGDEHTLDWLLKSEMNIVANRRAAVNKCSGALKQWMDERPACVHPDCETLSREGQWNPRPKSKLTSPPPPPGSIAGGAANRGKKGPAFASKSVSAGVPMLAANPWAGFGGVYDAKAEKKNRTPHPLHYDTTIRNMSSPKFLDTTKESIAFSQRCPRRSAIEAFDDTVGPRKPELGRVVRNPRRKLPRESMERLGMIEPVEPWLDSVASCDFVRSRRVPSGVSESERQELVDERAGFLVEQLESDGLTDARIERLPDGSLVVRTLVARHEKKTPVKKLPSTPAGPPLFLGETLDPYMLKAALKAAFGQRLIDLFREWDADESGQISKDEFIECLKMEMPLKKWFGFPNATKQDIDRTFAYFDRDGSGDLDLLELDKLLRVVPSQRPMPGEGAAFDIDGMSSPEPSPTKANPRRSASAPRSPRSPSPRASSSRGARAPSPRQLTSLPPPVDVPESPTPPPQPPQYTEEQPAEQLAPPQAESSASAPPSAPVSHLGTPRGASEDPIAKIKQLKELLDMGALTQQQFESKREELLSRV